MREIQRPLPVKLFVGMLSAEPALFDKCTDIFCSEYGPIDHQSDIVPWSNSSFYRDEMGPGIMRTFIFFERLLDPGDLALIKVNTIKIEKTLSVQADNLTRRRINLDPGYLTEAKVVLATTKDYSHRLYIGEGIYAEVTLGFGSKDRRFAPFHYTYPDYRSETNIHLFNNMRDLLRIGLQRPMRV